MITTKETLPNSRVKLTFTASHAQFEKALALELESVAKSVKIPGFRPGKAPEAKVIEQVGRRRLEAGAIDRVISLVYSEDMSGQREVIAVANPDRVDVTEFTVAPADATPETVVATFTLEVDVLPDVTIDGYKKIKLEKPAATKVEQDEVDKVVDYLRRQRAAMEDAPEGTKVETGMWVDLSYKGSVDDVPRDDMHNESHPIVVGEGQLIPGFEDHLIGMQAGEIKTFKITFPAEYHSEALQGKEAEFMVTVKELKVVKLPEIDADFAEAFGHDSADMLLDAIRVNLHEEKQQEQQRHLDEEVVEKLLALTNFELPQSLVEQELERQYEESRERLSKMNFQWEQYLAQTGKTDEQMREDMRPQAEKNVRVGLSLGRVVELEGIENTDQAPRKALDRLIEIASANQK